MRPVKVEAPVTESVPPVVTLVLMVVAAETEAAIKTADKIAESTKFCTLALLNKEKDPFIDYISY